LFLLNSSDFKKNSRPIILTPELNECPFSKIRKSEKLRNYNKNANSDEKNENLEACPENEITEELTKIKHEKHKLEQELMEAGVFVKKEEIRWTRDSETNFQTLKKHKSGTVFLFLVIL